MKTFDLALVALLLGWVTPAPALEQWNEEGELVEQQPGEAENFSAPPVDEQDDSDETAPPGALGSEPPPPAGEEGYFYVEDDDQDQPYQNSPPAGQVDDITYFYDALAPYGDWIWTPEYGWVWQPRGTWEDWRPYSYGRWVYTDYGWTWVSFFPWGWAPFHYGSWAFLEPFGWVWVPGTTWAPAWVIWRYSDDYIGWSPLLAGYGVWFGWAYYPVVYEYWTFIPWHHFCDPHPHHHYIPRRRVARIFRHTTYPRACRERGRPGCLRGPTSRFVSRASGRPVKPLRVENLASRLRSGRHLPVRSLGVHNDTVRIFRPRLKARPGVSPLPGMRPRRSIDLGIVPGSSRPRQMRPNPSRRGAAPGLRPQPVRRPRPGKTIFTRPPRPARSPLGPRSPGRRAPFPGRYTPTRSQPPSRPSLGRPARPGGNFKPAPAHSFKPARNWKSRATPSFKPARPAPVRSTPARAPSPRSFHRSREKH